MPNRTVTGTQHKKQNINNSKNNNKMDAQKLREEIIHRSKCAFDTYVRAVAGKSYDHRNDYLVMKGQHLLDEVLSGSKTLPQAVDEFGAVVAAAKLTGEG